MQFMLSLTFLINFKRNSQLKLCLMQKILSLILMSFQITSLEANLVLHREQLAMKDVQLRQLEEEIGNAHRCVRLLLITFR